MVSLGKVKGASDTQLSAGLNPYCVYFDADNLNHIGGLLAAIANSSPEVVNSW